MTIHKSQGQSFDEIDVYLRDHVKFICLLLPHQQHNDLIFKKKFNTRLYIPKLTNHILSHVFINMV